MEILEILIGKLAIRNANYYLIYFPLKAGKLCVSLENPLNGSKWFGQVKCLLLWKIEI